MNWIEHLLGVAAMLTCFILIPLGILCIACVLSSAKETDYIE